MGSNTSRQLKPHETIHAATDAVSRGVLECLGDAGRGGWVRIANPYQGKMPRALAPSGMAVGSLFPKDKDGKPVAADITGMVGYYRRDEHYYEFLKGHAALVNKLLVALDHEYRTPQYNLRQHISLPTLMDLLQFKRNSKGEHRTDNRRRVVKALEALSRIEVVVFAREGYTYDLKGSAPIWTIDPLGADYTPCEWSEVRAVRVRPDALARYVHYSDHIYRMCKDYLALPSDDSGRLALFLGAFLVHMTAIAAKKAAKRKTFRIDTLERWAGIQGYEKDPARRLEVLKRTLDLLKYHHLVAEWTDDCEPDHIRIAFQLADMPRPKRQHPFLDCIVEEPEATAMPDFMADWKPEDFTLGSI